MAATGGLVYKKEWSAKRQNKLRKMYKEICEDGKVTPKEIRKVLKKMGYYVDDYQAAQFLMAMDANGDGRLSYNEFFTAMKTFSMGYPKTPKYMRK